MTKAAAAAIALNEDQARAEAEIDMANAKGNEHLLDGAAGTGKTTLVIAAVKKMLSRKQGVAVTAPTHKALNVLREKMRAAGLREGVDAVTLCTIQSLLSLKPDNDADLLVFKRDKYAQPVLQDAVVVDECFVGETPVDTPAGPRRIDAIRPGDAILNAAGVDRVVATMKKEAGKIAIIHAAGKEVASSDSHRFFTRRGVVRASALRAGDHLLPVAEAVRRMRGELRTEAGLDATVLLRGLLDAVVAAVPGVQGEGLHAGAGGEGRGRAEAVAVVGRPEGGSREGAHRGVEPDGRSRGAGEDFRHDEDHRPQAEGEGRQRVGPHQAASPAARRLEPGLRGAVGAGVRASDRTGQAERLPEALQDRLGASADDGGDRGGRRLALHEEAPGAGPEEGRVPQWIGVDRVEVLEPGDPRLDRFREADGKLYLHDLQAERHSSFGVRGALVHNCSMVDADLRSHMDRHLSRAFVLCVGDIAQIPPVGERVSSTFKIRSRSRLTTIMRQAEGNPLLEAAHYVRQRQGTDDYDDAWAVERVNDARQGVYVPDHAKIPAWVAKAFRREAFDERPDSTRYLAWTNRAVDLANAFIRDVRYGSDLLPQPFMPGERIMFRQPLVVDDEPIFDNSEEATCVWMGPDTLDFAVKGGKHLESYTLKIPSWRINAMRDDGVEVEVHMCADPDAKRRAQERLANEAVAARKAGHAAAAAVRWRQFHGLKNGTADVGPIYGLTVHKSQGSTIEAPFVDFDNIEGCAAKAPFEMQQLMYTALTRASRAVILRKRS